MRTTMASTSRSSVPPCSDESLHEATGRDWKKWCAILDQKGARELSHTELARIINELHTAGGWWSQTIAVGYERLSGKRKLYGQPDGTFTAAVSKTLSAEPGRIYEAISNEKRRAKWAPGRFTLRNATPTKLVRLISNDGTRVTAYLQVKPNGKTAVSLEVAKLSKFESVAPVKEKWRAALEELAKEL